MEQKLKQLIKNQLMVAEIPSYFEWNDTIIFYDSGRWIVYGNRERLYGGVDFDTALEMLFN